MSVFYFYMMLTLAALCILGAIGQALAIALGYIHPWDFK